MSDKAHIKETFVSIQGEGPFIGCKQFFIRFCGCNLACNYCDTDFKGTKDSVFYTAETLSYLVKKQKDCHSVSLTGGEPLLHAGFLKEFLPMCSLPVYLETNATMSGSLSEIIDFVDYIAADIKLPSCTGLQSLWDEHDAFLEVGKQKNIFAKIVFDKNITEEEIIACSTLAAKHRVELILQPMMLKEKMAVDKDFSIEVLNKFLKKYKKVRLIPQVHKFLSVK